MIKRLYRFEVLNLLHLHRSAITERAYLEIIERYLERIRTEVRELDEVRNIYVSKSGQSQD